MPETDAHFVIAGAQRSGTSFLVDLLERHPAIRFARPLRPEPKFFLRPEADRADVEEYRALFTGSLDAARLLGEKSTSYMEREEVPRRIRRLLPAANLVFVLRDPVDRALSNYWFSVQHGAETAAMDEAFRNETTRRDRYDHERFSVSPFAYLQRGEYETHLRRFEEVFPREQLTLILFEDLVSSPACVTERLLAKLGLPWAGSERVPRSPVNAGPERRGEPEPELLRYLVRHFSEPNRRLAERFGLDLSPWRGMSPGSDP